MNIVQEEFDAAVLCLEPHVYRDQRGFFLEAWNKRAFEALGLVQDFVQDNHSFSVAGTLRGLHFQDPGAQGKLVWVAHGAIFDVVVDLRRSSRTFGQWAGFDVSSQNCYCVWIPPGFAHGFYTTADHAHVIYKCTDYYDPGAERVLLWKDPQINIKWPLLHGPEPLLSPRDQKGLRLAEMLS